MARGRSCAESVIKRRALSYVLLFLFCGHPAATALADTLSLKDGSEMKGIVIEEYKDRLLVSTADGETTVMKSEVRELRFDDEETNLVKLGDQAREARRYRKAVEYYGMALKANPASKKAKDGLLLLELNGIGSGKAAMKGDIKRRGDIDRDGGSIAEEKTGDDAVKEAQAALAKYIGIRLGELGEEPSISAVNPGSPAEMAGLKKGDILAAVWGKFTKYMNIKEVAGELTKGGSGELRCLIERDFQVKINQSLHLLAGTENVIGAGLEMGLDGLTISMVMFGGPAYAAGLKTGDIITHIGDNSIRYTPMKKVIELIKSCGADVVIRIRREIILWRRS
jgi:hypothetical protein